MRLQGWVGHLAGKRLFAAGRRFLQTDPTGYDDGLNWYAYVGNDPLNRSDPTGLFGNDTSMCGSDFNVGGCSTIIGGGDEGGGGGGGKARAVAAGAVVGGAVGAAASVTCDGATAMACTPANPAIVTGSAVAGGVLGGQLYDLGQTIKPALKDAGEAIETSVAQLVIHGNSARSQRATEVYHLINRDSGAIDKIGCTCMPGSRYSQAYLNANNVDYVTVWRYSSRYPALVHENIELTAYRALYGQLPRLNKLTR